MFFKVYDTCSSNIDSILGSEDVTLQKLMDEDDIIQECRGGNTKLLNFLSRPDTLRELVALVTREPPADDPEATRFKYNNIAAELLTCNLDSITVPLAGSEELLGQLCGFLDTDSELNPLMASFFSKTMSLLVVCQPKPLLEYLKSREGFLPRALSHLRTSGVMDLLSKMVTVLDKDNRELFAQWLCSERFVEQCISLLDSSADTSVHVNVAQLLNDMLRVLRDLRAQAVSMSYDYNQTGVGADTTLENDMILSALESKNTVDLLLTQILDKEPSSSSLIQGINILLVLLETKRPMLHLGNMEPESGDRPLIEPVITTCFRNTVEAVVPRLKDFHQLLTSTPETTSVHVNFVKKPLGAVRLQIARLLTALFGTGSWEIRKEVASLGTFTLLLDMFVEYSHNNFLHGEVERSVQVILGLKPRRLLQPAGQPEAESPEEPLSQLHPLLSSLLVDNKLTEWILNAWETNKDNESKGGRRYSYMGHLTRIANHVVEYGKNGGNSEAIRQLLSQLPEEVQQRWERFITTELAQTNRTNEIVPVQSEISAPKSSSEDEFVNIPHSSPRDAAAQEAFADYQTEIMNKHFVTRFGFADNQFTDNEDHRAPPDTLVNISVPDDDEELRNQSNMFEQLCSEKIQMDDVGVMPMNVSDEDDLLHDTSKATGVDDSRVVDMDIESSDPPAVVDNANPWDSQGSWTSDNNSENWANFDQFPASFDRSSETADPFAATVEPTSSDTNKSEAQVSEAPAGQATSIPENNSERDQQQQQHGNGPVQK